MTAWTDSLAEAIGLDGYATKTDGIGGVLPTAVNKALREQLKLELQLESMLEGKLPEKGEKGQK